MKPRMLNKLSNTVKRLVSRGRSGSFDGRDSEQEHYESAGEEEPLPSVIRVGVMYSSSCTDEA